MKTLIRVLYKDTDKMGVAYYANYLTWFEVGRAEYMRGAGCSYKKLEEKNYRMPIIEAYCRYYSPAFYDDLIEIDTHIAEANKIKVKFSYQIFRKSEGKLLAEGFTIHTCTDKNNNLKKFPEFLLKILNTKI